MLIFKLERKPNKESAKLAFKNKYNMPFWHKRTSKVYVIII